MRTNYFPPATVIVGSRSRLVTRLVARCRRPSPDSVAGRPALGAAGDVGRPPNIAASTNYRISRYGVADKGDNQRAMVAQANAGIHQGC